MAEGSVFTYSDEESETTFNVFSWAAFKDPAFFPEDVYVGTLDEAVRLCNPGVDRKYIVDSLDPTKNPDIQTHGWMGVLVATNVDPEKVKIIGIILFRDMRPGTPRVNRDFICAPSYGRVLNMFFDRHIVAHGRNLGDYRDVTVSLDSINAVGVLESHGNNGYARTGEVLNAHRDPHEHLIVMEKTIRVPHLGGRRRTRRRRQILLTYRRRYGRNERTSLRRKARRNA
jgi:hypothetical protein